MKTMLIALTAALLGSTGCRQRTTNMDDDGRSTAGKPVEVTQPHDDDFIETRRSFQANVNERLDRLATRLNELESRTDAAGHDAAVKMRAARDELATRSKEIANQTEAGWDHFQGELSRKLDQLEHDVDQLVD